jgi:L-2-hydroxyglutarate oxidase LhgO
METLKSPGFRALARKHWRMGVREMRGSPLKRAFVAEARRDVAELATADLVPAPAGVRAQAVDPDGSLVDDFRIRRIGPVTAVRNAPSPGATSSLAIAEYLVDVALAE